MIPIRIEGANVLFKAPEGLPEVKPLFVRMEGGVCFSRWEPTPDELELLNAGGSVELAVIGHQPPVSLIAVPHCDTDEEKPPVTSTEG